MGQCFPGVVCLEADYGAFLKKSAGGQEGALGAARSYHGFILDPAPLTQPPAMLTARLYLAQGYPPGKLTDTYKEVVLGYRLGDFVVLWRGVAMSEQIVALRKLSPSSQQQAMAEAILTGAGARFFPGDNEDAVQKRQQAELFLREAAATVIADYGVADPKNPGHGIQASDLVLLCVPPDVAQRAAEEGLDRRIARGAG